MQYEKEYWYTLCLIRLPLSCISAYATLVSHEANEVMWNFKTYRLFFAEKAELPPANAKPKKKNLPK